MKIVIPLLAAVLLTSPSFARNPHPSPTPYPPPWGVNSECVQQGCFYGHCDFDSDVEAVTKACTGVRDGSCVRTICNHRGDCSMLSRFVKYANLCAGRNY